MATYDLRNDSLVWKEQHIYGSSRLGVLTTEVLLDGTVDEPYFENLGKLTLGAKRYELSNHLGNVLACLLYTSPSPRDATLSRMPSSA